MKKPALAALLLLLALLFSGCIGSTGHYITTMCVSNQSDDAFSMRYDSFDGQKTYSFRAKENASLTVEFETRSGTLSCSVTDGAGKEYYKNDDVQTENLTIPLGEKGKYKVSLFAKEHEGGFSFTIT